MLLLIVLHMKIWKLYTIFLKREDGFGKLNGIGINQTALQWMLQ